MVGGTECGLVVKLPVVIFGQSCRETRSERASTGPLESIRARRTPDTGLRTSQWDWPTLARGTTGTHIISTGSRVVET